jgi:hypothetical protein
MFTMNIRYSLSGYGIESVSLHPEVIAQTNGTGTGGGSGSESGGSGSGSESGNGSGSGSSSGSESGSESGGTSSGNFCPSPYDVPNRFIKASYENHTVTSNSQGEISVTVEGKTAVKGGYQKNKPISVSVKIFNCTGEQNWACCKQSDVRIEIQ